MQSSFQREKIADGVTFSHITDTKFYSNRLSIHFITKLDPGAAACNAIVPAILRLGCRVCPDFTALNRRLGLLYGAQLDGGAIGYGENQVMSVFVKGLDGRVTLHGEDMSGELTRLLCDIVFDPLVEGGGFSPTYTELEKTNLVDAIESEINDKRLYAQRQCIALLFGDSSRAVRPCGTVETARAITPAAAYAAYRALLGSARIEIQFVGSGDASAARDVFAARFKGMERELQELAPRAPEFPDKLLERTETMEISQSKLVLCFSSSPREERETYALRMMAALYGGTPFAKLFVNVREKLGLCYYCSARYDRGNRLMMVSSGVEEQNAAAARGEILRQLDALRDGDFTDEELGNTQLAMNTGFAATGDSLYALGSWYLTQLLAGTAHSPSQEREQMAALTRADVIAAAQNVQLRAAYLLIPPGDRGNG